jgi:YD repeat-containing protein
VTKQVDARSVETDFTYDAAARVLTKTFPAASSENVAFTYDATAGGNKGVGRLTSLTDQSGSDALLYDAQGRATTDTRVIGANSYATAYTYDAAGHVLTETYPSGRIVTYSRDTLGRVSGVTTKQNAGASPVTVGSSVTYEPFGPLDAMTRRRPRTMPMIWTTTRSRPPIRSTLVRARLRDYFFAVSSALAAACFFTGFGLATSGAFCSVGAVSTISDQLGV